MDYNKLLRSKSFGGIIWGIAGLAILLLVFKAGVFVGFRKANFSYIWGENYHRNFAGPRGGFFKEFSKGFAGKDFIEASGTIGQIVKIDGKNLVIKGRDNAEKIIVVKDDTSIVRGREKIKVSGLKVDDFVVIIGEPNASGQIEAKFIRNMPAPRR